ncbi:DNA replication and repair protein RecF [Candidatus Saccharibacteria bacterium]|nr:DNA replication and repair protein RecF [Candidatus Saccharibacteria bacterium]
MILRRVKLQNFRSHEAYVLDFEPEITQILGENGWGKTSVLEAIYITLRGKSFRATDKDILRRGSEFYRIETEFNDGARVVAVFLGSEGKTFLVEDKKVRRLPKKNRYPVVLFLPDDLRLVGTSPTKKRDYFDKVLNQFSTGFSTALSRYNKALKQRNELLKQDFCDSNSLFSWDVMLAKYGVEIRDFRKKLVLEINERLTEVYRSIAQVDDEVELIYEPYIGDVDESGYLKLLALDYDRDRLTGHTNFGIHKDDFEFLFNGVDASVTASRGETRSVVIALKFIEADLLYEKIGVRPIILLDDVFSELDETRQKALIKNFKDNQVVLTSVGESSS